MTVNMIMFNSEVWLLNIGILTLVPPPGEKSKLQAQLTVFYSTTHHTHAQHATASQPVT